MLANFCLRLACGMIGCLLLLSPAQVNPRFFRVHCLTVLGLSAAAGFLRRDTNQVGFWIALGSSMLCAFLGSLVWALEKAPGGRMLVVANFLALVSALGVLVLRQESPQTNRSWLFVGELTSGALLGFAITAMLMGHSYLIAPSMSIVPLRHLLVGLFISLLLNMAVAGVGLWSWTAEHSLVNLEDETVLWLPVRWLLGFMGPIVLGAMAWQTARIRSTQSATGILFVVVILCFLGDLTGQLLLGHTGYLL